MIQSQYNLALGDILKTVDLLARREAVLIEAARKPGFSVDDLREAFKKQQDIH